MGGRTGRDGRGPCIGRQIHLGVSQAAAADKFLATGSKSPCSSATAGACSRPAFSIDSNPCGDWESPSAAAATGEAASTRAYPSCRSPGTTNGGRHHPTCDTLCTCGQQLTSFRRCSRRTAAAPPAWLEVRHTMDCLHAPFSPANNISSCRALAGQ